MALDILNKFTTNLKHTLVRAINSSIQLKHPKVLPLHLLISLSKQNGSIANEIIHKYKLHPELLEKYLHSIQWPQGERSFALPQLSAEAVQVLEHAAVVAFEHQHKYIGTEHLLLSIIEMPDRQLQKVFKANNVSSDNIRKQVVNVLKSTSRFPDLGSIFTDESEDSEEVITTEKPDFDKEPTSNTPALDFFSTNLTDTKIQKDIDPVIGREEEVERLIHILSRRTKNNPILLGEPGVGKTAIAEGLAKRIITGKVPDVLLHKKIFRLDLGLVVAGTMYRGEFEARFKQITDELKENKDIILFIDEIHTLIGAGGTGGNAMDAANILKPGLARGEIRCIGATTLQEYRKHIESDSALERRFQPIHVEEPSIEDAIEILKGIRKNYEQFHRVNISDHAIEEAVKLSVRYNQDKFLPDKAIDLIDEAAARHRVRKSTNPLEQSMFDLEKKLRVIQSQKLTLVRDEKFEEAIDLKKKEREIKGQLESLTKQVSKMHQKHLGTISAEDVAAVVARMTKIPIEELIDSEKKRLVNLQEALDANVIGQPEATKAVADVVRRSRAGLNVENRPTGSFIFLGPSGVGKTELAKTLARTVFGSEDNIIRIDMSEFSEGFTTSKLIGAPAGYVGYKEGAKLTDQVKHRPYSIVLFDEIEKAHRDVFNLLLQILDEGHLTDSTGKKINFKNTIIIMTSNVGLKQFRDQAKLGFAHDDTRDSAPDYETVKDDVLKELREQFRPEFLNRIDKLVVFKPLLEDDILAIVDLRLQDLYERAKERGITLNATKALKKHIAKIGYTPDEGARALQRAIQDAIENPLAEKILSDEFLTGDKISIGYKNKEITFTKRK